MEHKVIITDYANDINVWLTKGWLVKSVTAQHIGGTSSYAGKFVFVLEKTTSDF